MYYLLLFFNNKIKIRVAKFTAQKNRFTSKQVTLFYVLTGPRKYPLSLAHLQVSSHEKQKSFQSAYLHVGSPV